LGAKAPLKPLPAGLTTPHDILITANGGGARITVNGQEMGHTPLHIKVYGDRDGTFHDFGSYSCRIMAYPWDSNQFVQLRVFATNRNAGGGDPIPEAVHFDLDKPTTYGGTRDFTPSSHGAMGGEGGSVDNVSPSTMQGPR
jgi:hypothetical protein